MEQPLPPYGACLLGSFNLVKYILPYNNGRDYWFDWDAFLVDIPIVVRAMDNVIDVSIYPLEEQKKEAQSKRRMGLGVTGLANTLEILGMRYGSDESIEFVEDLMTEFRDAVYRASIELAREKGPFPLFSTSLLKSDFALTLPEDIRKGIATYGLRNSHLLSIAPTGTISLSADNVSSGIEPPYALESTRTIQTFEGPIKRRLTDYAFREYGVAGKTADETTVEEHVRMLNTVSYYVDSSCSKTCNVGPDVSWERFKNVYMMAYEGGATGCTTFRLNGKRFGIFEKATSTEEKPGGACFIDPDTGIKTCDS